MFLTSKKFTPLKGVCSKIVPPSKNTGPPWDVINDRSLSTTKKRQNLKNAKVRFLLNIDVRQEMEDSRLNAIKQLIAFVKSRLNFSCKSTTAANVDLT